MSDTPRMTSALLDDPEVGFTNVWKVGCDIEIELNSAQDRIKQLQDVIKRASSAFFCDGSDRKTSVSMLTILEDENNTLRSEESQLLNTNGEMERRIQRLEEELMDAKNKHAVLVADVVLDEDRGERIKRLEEAGDYLCAAAAFLGLHDKIDEWNKAKEDKL